MSVNKEMDDAAAKAQEDLAGMIQVEQVSRESLKFMASWVRRWYMQAGYKRLAKILMEEVYTQGRNNT